ncbi:MAG: DNA/RNA endonuclease G [Microbacteriaceae bacterium]|nr:DNA/RNA endonuclease G [Microbacteriaceae bacterium]
MSGNTLTPRVLAQLINRRETRSPRSALAIMLALIVIFVCVYTVIEIILQLSGQPALLMTVGAAAQSLPEAASAPAAVPIAAVAAVLGVIVLALAVTPGKRAKHTLDSDHSVVVDNAVIASALARHAAGAAQVAPDNVRVSVSHRTAEVRITPASGTPIDPHVVTLAVEEQVALYRANPPLRAKVIIESVGRVGA